MIVPYTTNRLAATFKTGDLVKVCVLRSVRPKVGYFMRRLKRPLRSRRLRGRLRVWRREIPVARGYRFWRFIPVFGRVIFLNSTNAGWVVGLYIRVRKQGIVGTFLLGAANVVGVTLLKKSVVVGRKSLRVIMVRRRLKLRRVFPLRRVGRINHKVK